MSEYIETSKMPMGWGLPTQSKEEIKNNEKIAFGKLARAMPERVLRAPAKDIKNMEIVGKILDLQKQDGIEEGFSFLHLERALFGKNHKFKAQIAGSCHPADTMVRMSDGSEKAIQDIKIGDWVVGHSGQKRQVLNTFERQYSGDVHTLDVFGHPFKLQATSEHPIATVPWSGWRYDQSTADLENLNWTRADELSEGQDRLLVAEPKFQETTDIKKIDLLELLGEGFDTVEQVKAGNMTGETKVETKTAKRHKYGIARKLVSKLITKVTDLTVYDIEVEEDHSFIANGLIVHNCVASGGRIVDTYRMLTEVFIFNEAQDLMGNEFQGVMSYQPFAPFSYRLGRSIAGINGGSASGRDDGSLCAPHFQGKLQTGFLPCSARGLESDFYPEPQKVSTYREWGANDRLVDQFKDQVTAKLVETEKIQNASDLSVVLIQHLKPLQICSMWAFEAGQKHPSWTDGGQPVTIYKRSRQEWAHNMSIVGVVKVAGNWYTIIKNTWGDMHSGRDWFPIPLELMDRWLADAESQTVGNIDFLNPHTSAI